MLARSLPYERMSNSDHKGGITLFSTTWQAPSSLRQVPPLCVALSALKRLATREVVASLPAPKRLEAQHHLSRWASFLALETRIAGKARQSGKAIKADSQGNQARQGNQGKAIKSVSQVKAVRAVRAVRQCDGWSVWLLVWLVGVVLSNERPDLLSKRSLVNT